MSNFSDEESKRSKKALLSEFASGQLRIGVVIKITDFGALVDLGGIEGMLWKQDLPNLKQHPSEWVKLNHEVEVIVLDVDHDKETIDLALWFNRPTTSPWDDAEKSYPVGARIRGEVVSIVPYGAFVKLEDGVEGLVHISEMSWTMQLNHPTELVHLGDIVEVVVLESNNERQVISLSMKLAQRNSD